MMNFLRDGRELSFKTQFYNLFKFKYNRSRTLYGLLVSFLFFLFSNQLVAQEPRGDSEADGRLNIKPLVTGDTVPETIWELPLQIVKHNEKTRTVKLSDFRGKIIIFDYWATWCKSCILAIPKMHELARQFPDEVVLVTITGESEDLIKNFLVKTQSPQIRSLEKEFETVVNGNILKALIPHRTLPHLGVINESGVLEIITKPRFINHDLLSKLIRKEDYYLPSYSDTLDRTLLSSNFQDRKEYKPVYYSTLMGFLDGFIFPSGETINEAGDSHRGFFINSPILKLFQIATRPSFNMLVPSRRIFVLDDTTSVDFVRTEYDYRRFNYSYEYVLPKDLSDDQIKDRMWRDLTDFTGYHACIIKREIPCLVIRQGANVVIKKSETTDSSGLVLDGIIADRRTPFYVGNSQRGARNYVRDTYFNNLVSWMNRLRDNLVPFVINETNLDYPVNIDLPDKLYDLTDFTATLQKQGLIVSLENRIMDVFVFADKPIDVEEMTSAPLKLGKSSYIIEKEGRNE